MQIVPKVDNRIWTHEVHLDYTDFSDADTSESIDIFPGDAGTLPVGTAVMACAVICTTGFTGPSLSSVTVTVGDSAAAARYIAAATTEFFATHGTPLKYSVGSAATYPSALTAASAVKLVLATTGCNINALTAGKIVVLLAIEDLTRFKHLSDQ